MTDHSPSHNDDSGRARRRGRLGIVALLGGLAAIGVGVWRTSGTTDQSSTPVVFEPVQVAAPVTPPGGANAPVTPPGGANASTGSVAVPSPPAPVTTLGPESPTTLGASTLVAPPTTGAAAPTTIPASSLSGPSSIGTAAAYSVIEDGTMYLRGEVPDAATATRVADEMSFRKGGQVVNELTINPSAPQPTAIPLFVPTAALFAAEGAELLEGIGPTLDVVSSLLRNTEATKLLIRGHTDDQGSEAYNFALSQQRVAAVLAYLVRSGVDANRLVVEPRGEVEPIADNATTDGRARNRRVELVLVAA